jgi:DNA-binding NarL/FixJ family response regulator
MKLTKRDLLTPRQIEIIKLISRGYADKEVAVELGISSNTVGGHVTQILLRLRCRSRTQAAVKFHNR